MTSRPPSNEAPELWRSLALVPGYEVSNKGRVRRVGGAVLSLRSDARNPYQRVRLRVGPRGGRKTKTFKVHHLVLHAFVGERPEGMLGLHADDDPANNNVENLSWGTPKQNAADRQRNRAPRTHCRNGHAYTEENTGWTRLGYRFCRACRKANAERNEKRNAASWVQWRKDNPEKVKAYGRRYAKKRAEAAGRTYHPHEAGPRRFCKRGHDKTAENGRNTNGQCRKCQLMQVQAYHAREAFPEISEFIGDAALPLSKRCKHITKFLTGVQEGQTSVPEELKTREGVFAFLRMCRPYAYRLPDWPTVIDMCLSWVELPADVAASMRCKLINK